MSLIIPNTFAIRTGTVQLELLDDNFDYLTNAIDSISLLSLSTSSTNLSGAGGVLDTILPSGEVSGYVLTTTGAGSYQWSAAPGAVTTVGTKIDTQRQTFTASASQTVYTLTGGLVYTPGSGQLRVYIDGVRQFPSAYTETSTTVFTLSTGVDAGTIVLAEIDGYVSYPIVASDISYSPAGGSSISGTTVQAAISELETEKAPNNSPTLSSPTLSNPTLSGTITVGTQPIYGIRAYGHASGQPAAWVSQNGFSATITSNDGAGYADYSITFSSNPPNANYTAMVTAEIDGTTLNQRYGTIYARTISGFRMRFSDDPSTNPINRFNVMVLW